MKYSRGTRGYAALKLREQSYKTVTSHIMGEGPADVDLLLTPLLVMSFSPVSLKGHIQLYSGEAIAKRFRLTLHTQQCGAIYIFQARDYYDPMIQVAIHIFVT